MGKQKKQKEQAARRAKDNKLQVGSNIQESYEDVVNRNKQQIFKQDLAKKSQLMDIDIGDDFEEQNFGARPESKAERPRSRNKDMGLSASMKNSDASDD